MLASSQGNAWESEREREREREGGGGRGGVERGRERYIKREKKCIKMIKAIVIPSVDSITQLGVAGRVGGPSNQ
jgi:hypothetical protein